MYIKMTVHSNAADHNKEKVFDVTEFHTRALEKGADTEGVQMCRNFTPQETKYSFYLHLIL